MSLNQTFAASAHPKKPERRLRKKRPAPFSIRLSQDERAKLEAEAKGIPLGAYVKAKALGAPPIALRRVGASLADQSALAKLLALLGRSRLANNINQIAYAVNTGSLPVTPETEAELAGALRDVRDVRRLLLVALGLKAGDTP